MGNLYNGYEGVITSTEGEQYEVYCGKLLHPMVSALVDFKEGRHSLQDMFTDILMFASEENPYLSNKPKGDK